MRLLHVIGILLFAQVFWAQQSRYDSLVIVAKREMQQKSFHKSSALYVEAFKAINYKAFAPDRYIAAKVLSMSENFDSAFVYLNILWSKSEYIETDSLLEEAMFQPLQADSRWQKLIFETTPKMPELAKNLAAIKARDQEHRQLLKSIAAAHSAASSEYMSALKNLNIQDSLNRIEVFSILDRYGWLGRNDIGNTGCSALFLVVQHAPVEAQEKYLPLLRAAVKSGNARRQNLAYLEDRILVRRNKKQLYGSQIKPAGRGYFPIIDIEHLNERREYVGLVSFNEAEMAEIRRQSKFW